MNQSLAAPSYFAGNSALAPKGPSEIEHQMERLGNGVEGLEKNVAALAERLSPVLRMGGGPAQTAAKEPPEEVLSLHAHGLRELAKRAANANAALSHLLTMLAV